MKDAEKTAKAFGVASFTIAEGRRVEVVPGLDRSAIMRAGLRLQHRNLTETRDATKAASAAE